MAERQLDIVLKVKDLASGGFKQAAQSARAMSRQLTDTNSGAIKAASTSMEQMAKFQQLAAGITMAAESAKVGFTGVQAVVDLMKGDIEDATNKLSDLQAGLRQLPFGVGPVVGIVQDIRAELSGEAAELRKITAETERLEKRNERLAQSNTKTTAYMDSLKRQTKDLQRQTEDLLKSGAELAKQQLQREIADKRAAAEAAYQEQVVNVKQRKSGVEKGLEKAGEQYQNVLDELRAFEAVRMKQIREAADAEVKAREDAAKAAGAAEAERLAREEKARRDADQRELDEKRRQADKLAALQADIHEQTLRANGMALEADIAAIRENTRQQIAAATDEAEQALLRQREQLAIDQVRKRHAEREAKEQAKASGITPEGTQRQRFGPRAVESLEIGRGFLGHAARYAEGNSMEARQVKAAEQTATDTKSLLDELRGTRRQIADVLRNNRTTRDTPTLRVG